MSGVTFHYTILLCRSNFFQIKEERAAAAKLKLLNSPSFDYFARLKKSMLETETDHIYSSTIQNIEDQDHFVVQKAPMMSLLPGKI